MKPEQVYLQDKESCPKYSDSFEKCYWWEKCQTPRNIGKEAGLHEIATEALVPSWSMRDHLCQLIYLARLLHQKLWYVIRVWRTEISEYGVEQFLAKLCSFL